MTTSRLIGKDPWLEPQQMQMWVKSFWVKNVVKLELERCMLPFVTNVWTIHLLLGNFGVIAKR